MDKNSDFNSFYGYQGYSNQDSFDNQYADFNPMAQYEQGYIYYKYLTQQLEYKIKCKEFEKLCSETKENRNSQRVC